MTLIQFTANIDDNETIVYVNPLKVNYTYIDGEFTIIVLEDSMLALINPIEEVIQALSGV